MLSPEQIQEKTAAIGAAKVKKSMLDKFILGFIAGGLIAIGYMGYIKVSASFPAELSSLGIFLGASVFPVGLIGILMGGGELATGNMMAVSQAFFTKKISFLDMVSNWLVISLANLLGALFVAYFLGHLTGLTSSGLALETTINVANSKVAATPLQAFLSGVGCNWLVGLAVWLNYGAEDGAGRVLVIWFPIMAFVAIGFQHSIANMFVVPAGIFAGGVTWGQFWANLIPVWLGNIVGGAGAVSFLYYIALGRKKV